jgi:hypothetical protein
MNPAFATLRLAALAAAALPMRTICEPGLDAFSQARAKDYIVIAKRMGLLK